MKKLILALIVSLCLVGCGNSTTNTDSNNNINKFDYSDAVSIVLGNTITVDGNEISNNDNDAVYLANDIVYYEEGKDASYGEGTEADGHSQAEADAHVVVHITKAGTYRLSGTLSKGQVAVDLGDDAEEDPNAVVTLVLDNVNITCEVAPGIIFYNVYESENTDKAGANVYIADGSTNTVNGSYVAKIYKEGTEKKKHKYDGAFYSKKSMIINGNTGVLNINAENEGLDTEMHLTINGGVINITANNDGINVNEDGVSIFTMNGGILTVDSGYGEEGDGIDSNGSIVINGGTIVAMPCNLSADGGIDSDLGITINGGTVIGFGMNGTITEDSKQAYISSNMSGTSIVIKSGKNVIYTLETPRSYSKLIFSSSDIKEDGTYSVNDVVASINVNNGFGGFPGGNMGGGNFDPNNMPEGMQRPNGNWGNGEFDPNAMPGGNMGGFNGNFDPNNMPEGMNPNNMPGGFNGHFDPNNMPNGQMWPSGNNDSQINA